MEFVQFDFKALRKELNLSQNEIAEKLGWNVRQWQKLEYGTTPDPRASTIAHICKTLEVDANWLLGLRPTAEPPCRFAAARHPATWVRGVPGSVTK